MSGYLELASGQTIALHDDFLIGRGKVCDHVIHDTKASRRHARFVIEGGVVEIEDLDSSNGTFLNGKDVTRRMVRPGDKVQIGATVFVYREGELEGEVPARTGTEAGPSAAPAPAAAASAAMFDEEDELFAGGSAAPRGEVEQPEPVSEPTPEPLAPKQAPAPLPPAPEPARPGVVEFADETIEVKQPMPSPAAKAPRAPSRDAVSDAGPRVLQYSKNAASQNVLGDDVGQMSGGMRALVFALVIVGMAGIAWLVIGLVR